MLDFTSVCIPIYVGDLFCIKLDHSLCSLVD